MLKRSIGTAILLTLTALAIGLGGIYGGMALLGLIALLAQWEFYCLLDKMGVKTQRALGLFTGAAWMAMVGGLIFLWDLPRLVQLASAALMAWVGASCFVGVLLSALRQTPAREVFLGVVGTVFGFLYVPFLLSFFYLNYFFAAALALRWPLGFTLMVIFAAKACDIGGYVVGSRIGRHKLAPKISPGKSWEGLAGGVLFSLAAGGAYYYFAFRVGHPDIRLGFWLSFCALIALVSLASDLFESAAKRAAGQKDSGRTIPGIGGALDLVDSLLFVAPVSMAFFPFWQGQLF